MDSRSLPIRFSGHAREQLERRGASEQEVIEAVRQGTWGHAEGGRRDSRANVPFDAEWNGHTYAQKQVRPIFIEENGKIVVITVYVYYLERRS